MGLFSKRKSESPTVDEILSMNDKKLREVIKTGAVPQKTPKELRDAAKKAKRAAEGERGFGAIRDAKRHAGTGNRNYHNIPLKDRVHPAEYKRILEREAKKQGLL